MRPFSLPDPPRTILALLAIHVLAPFGWARAIHVSPKGSDLAAGTAEAPWATLAKAAGASLPGDTIRIHEGTWRLEAQLAPNSGSEEGGAIVWTAAPGASVLIDGGTGTVASFATRHHIAFLGLRFTTANASVGAGMFYFEASRHIRFEGCEFFGMPAETGAENASVMRCMSTGWPDEANLQNSDSCVFRDNLFRDNAVPAFRLYDTKGWRIENNTFRNCAQAVGGKDEPYDMRIRRNLVVGGGTAFYFPMQGGGDGATISENIVVGAGTGIQIGGLGTYGNKRRNLVVANNTFHNVRNWLSGWSDAEFDTLIAFRNNIVSSTVALNIGAGEDVAARFVNVNKYQAAPMRPSQYAFDHNLYRIPADDRSTPFIDGRESFASLEAWTAGRPGFDAHSIAADPGFLSVDDSDFHLAPTSPARGKGSAGEDLGAYPRGDDGTVIGRRVSGGLGVPRRSARNASSSLVPGTSFGIDGRRPGTATPASGVRIGPGEGGEAILRR